LKEALEWSNNQQECARRAPQLLLLARSQLDQRFGDRGEKIQLEPCLRAAEL